MEDKGDKMYIKYYGKTKHYGKLVDGIECLSLTPFGLLETIKALNK